MVFDADNLLHPNFVREINKAFVVNGNVVNGYRNTKNFDTNIISAAYGIHFYRSIIAYHRPRSRLGIGTHIAGTGFVIASKHLVNGWKYYLLAEDAELTNDLASKNIKIGFCEDAVFYDEQPTNFIVGFRQRVRWERGRLGVFLKYGYKLLFGMFRHLSFTMYDLFFYLLPVSVLSLIKTFIYPIIMAIIYSQIQTGNFWLDLLKSFGTTMGMLYVTNALMGMLVIIREYKSLHVKFYKAFLYALVSPWFNMISYAITIVAVLKPRVKWTPVKHDDTRKVSDLLDK